MFLEGSGWYIQKHCGLCTEVIILGVGGYSWPWPGSLWGARWPRRKEERPFAAGLPDPDQADYWENPDNAQVAAVGDPAVTPKPGLEPR